MQSPKFLTVSETAAALHVSRPTIWRHITNKTLPATKLGRRVLIPSSALDALQAAAMAGTIAETVTTPTKIDKIGGAT